MEAQTHRTDLWTRWRKERVGQIERVELRYIHHHLKTRQQEPAVQRRELSTLFCDDLEGWSGGMGGRFKREGIYVYTWLIHFAVQKKLTQHCKASIFQFKKKKKKMPNTGLTPSWPKHRWDVDRSKEKFTDPGTTLLSGFLT